MGEFQFVNWDDPVYVTENEMVRRGLGWQTAWWAITTAHAPYWHPLTWLSHLLDVRLFGLDPGAHHLMNLLLHTANSLGVYLLLRTMTSSWAPSAVVSALFAVHPLHVESVAWVAERKDVLSAFLSLATIGAYIRYTMRPGWSRYLAVHLWFVVALLAKPMVVTVPLLLLLLDIWPLRRLNRTRDGSLRRLVLEKLPMLIVACCIGVATVVIQEQVGAMPGLGTLAWSERLQNSVVGYGVYLGKVMWPIQLSPFYPMRSLSPFVVAGAIVLLVALSAMALKLRTGAPYVLVGWTWYLLSLAPVIGLLQAGEQALADRFVYMGIIGPLVAVAWGALDAAERLHLSRRVLGGVALVIIAAAAIVARQQVRVWSDSVTLWTHALRMDAANYRAYENLGQALRDSGRFKEAEASYRMALQAAPLSWSGYRAVVHNSIGLTLLQAGRQADSAAEFEEAVARDPDFAEARVNLGNALASVERFDEASEHFAKAIQLDPTLLEPQLGLGSTWLRRGDGEEALRCFEAALRLAPDSAEAHNGLGAALGMTGHEARARVEYERALQLNPELVSARTNLGALSFKQGRFAEAVDHFEAVLRREPGRVDAKAALEAARRAAGRER